MSKKFTDQTGCWERLRFAIVGPLFSNPPKEGKLREAFEEKAATNWLHPGTGQFKKYSASTIARWYYMAAKAPDPIKALRRCSRSDAGNPRCVSPHVFQFLDTQYQEHPGWTVQLHLQNLVAAAQSDNRLIPVPSYPTIRRLMKAQGWHRKRRSCRQTKGEKRAQCRLERAEVRSFENAYVGGLWHLDFHESHLQVVTPKGEWVRPKLLGIIDDHSRLICHCQWYWDETAECLIHGLSQALQKRGIPRALMTDNGAAMKADEFTEGLHQLSVFHEYTLPYSPYQNGKQEKFWAVLESRFIAMLENVAHLTLQTLNELTLVWVEQSYHRSPHKEIGVTPLSRYIKGKSVSRPCVNSQALRRAFRLQATRRQRRTDGTISVQAKRFEIPARYQHLEQILVRYARWDMTTLEMIDPHTQDPLCTLFPLDKTANATGERRRLVSPTQAQKKNVQPPTDLPPYLEKLKADFAATGRPPAYLPKHEKSKIGEEK